MKIKLLPKIKQMASTLLTTLFICSLLGLSTMGYLSLVEYQNRLSYRSQSWNLTISLVEAGIEEGLAHLNLNYDNLNVDGWVYQGNDTYLRTRTMPTGTYEVQIVATDIQYPTVAARATMNLAALAQSRRSWFLATVGVDAQNGDNTTVSRAVMVHTYRGKLFTKALVAKNTIDMNGNNVRTDSFDSTDPLYSTNGRYDADKIKDKGDVASNTNIVNAVDVGNANVYGHVATGPGGTIGIGANGAVGSVSWHEAGTGGIEPGWSSDNSNFTFPDTQLPYSSGFAPESGYVVTAVVNTNAVTTNTTYYPDPPPLTGVITNVSYATNSTMPSPIPDGLQTNVATVTASSLPNPTPSGTITTNTASATTAAYPSPGTYIGSVTTNWHASGKRINSYTYTKINSYSYTVTSYIYPSSYSYTYLLVSMDTLYTTNYYNNVLYSGDYYASSLSGSTIVLGNARLVLPNGLSMSGSDQFTVASGASIEIYSGGSVDLGGNGVINQDGLAQSFILYCAPSVTSVSIGGNGEFVGVIVAPSAHLHLHGGGNDTRDFIGSALVNSATLSGHFNFHYDEALGKLPPNGRYLITRWDEITDW